MTKKYYLLRSIASLLSFIFGFSATVAAQYGAIETTYKINGNVSDLLSNVPIEGIKISMKSHENTKTTTQSDSLGHFEIAVNGWALDNTYYFTAEDIDGVQHSGEYLPADTSLLLNFQDFQLSEPRGHWQIEKKCRYEVDLKLAKAEAKADSQPAKPATDEDSIITTPLILPKDSLLLGTSDITSENPEESWSMLEVFPNPTNELVEIIIDASQDDEIRLQLFDDSYKALFEKTQHLHSGSNQFTIDLKGFSAGNYLLVAMGSDNRIVRKIIKL